jgi:ubiquinone/menaquinone biosynthesis C-methylase UbiE
MGFFSVPMAAMVGAEGRVVCVDVQEKMLESLRKRAAKVGVDDRIEVLNCAGDEMGLDNLRGEVDFALAFAMVHEVDDPEALIHQIHSLLKKGGHLLVAEPRGHVSSEEFDDTLRWSAEAGFRTVDRPAIGRSHAALLEKTA